MIKNIIFDLGGVILNINYQKTSEEFKKLGLENFDELYSQAQQSHLFDYLERGVISNETFRNEIRRLSKLDLTDSQIDSAWNAMLLDLPKERIDILLEAKKHYHTFLLSNTNDIHLKAYTRNLYKEHNIKSLSELFEEEFFSHKIQLRKPDVEAFLYVINKMELVAEETLFIDDSAQHLVGAQQSGMKTHFMDVKNGMTLSNLFENGFLKKEVEDGA